MIKYVALLKGVNVGGHKKVPMADLRELLAASGFADVKTYIQSGNVILKSSKTNLQNLEVKIQELILKKFGFEVSVLVKTQQSLQRIFDDCPFDQEKKVKSYFTFLQMTPDDELVKIASAKVYEGEAYKIINDCIYFYCEKGYGKAKFNINYFERQLKTIATARNYNTMAKLLSMSM